VDALNAERVRAAALREAARMMRKNLREIRLRNVELREASAQLRRRVHLPMLEFDALLYMVSASKSVN
jgi:hypothetical protein